MEKIILTFNSDKYIQESVAKFEDIKGRFVKSGVTPQNLMVLIISLMTEANRIKGLTGTQKKMLVTSVLNDIIEKAVPEGPDEKYFERTLKDMVPGMIDTFSEISKGTLLKKVKNWCCC